MDTELESRDECLCELIFSVLRLDKFDVNDTANDEVKWYINKNLELANLSVCASNCIPSDTSIEVDDDVWSAIDYLTSLQVLKKSSFLTKDGIDNVRGAFFEVPAHQ